MDLRELANYSALTFTSVLCVANPVRAASSLAGLTEGWPEERRARVARRSLLLATGVLIAAAWTASGIVYAVNIHVGGLRVGAGLLLVALMASDTVRLTAARRGSTEIDPAPPEVAGDEHAVGRATAARIASAGTLATAVLYSGEWFELWRRAVSIAAILATAAVAYPLLRFGDRVRAGLGEGGVYWISIAMNLITVAWVADFTAIGVRDLLPLVLGSR